LDNQSGGFFMARYDTFAFRVTREERQLIAALAERLQRSQSDAVRLLVRGAAKELGVEPDAYSGENDQRFRMMAITQTDGCRSLIPVMAIMQQGNDAGCGIITLAVVGVQWRVNFPHRLSF
jgi:hypothetical protein